MALTINSQPSNTEIKSAYRALRYEVESDDGTIVNIIADLWIDGSYYKTVTHAVDGADISTFDMQRILAGRIAELLESNTWHLPDIEDGTITLGTSYDLNLQVKFFEHTENASTGLLETDWAPAGAGTPVGATSNTIVVIPATLQHNETQSLADYMMGDANSGGYTTKKFLTNAPLTQTIYGLTQDAYLCAYIDYADASTTKLRILKRNAAGAPLGEHRESYTATGFTIFPCGTNNINDLSAGFIDSAVDHYEVSLIDDDLTVEDVSETFTFNLDLDCQPENETVHFLNKKGGFDTFVFRDVTNERVNVARSKSGKSIPYDFTTISPSVETMAVESGVIYRSQQDGVTTTEAAWLYELLATPKAYLDRSATRYPMNLAPGEFGPLDNDDPVAIIQIKYSIFEDINQIG